MYGSVGEYDKARENLEKSLAIRKEIGDRKGEASCYGDLGTVYSLFGEYGKAREHLQKSLAITKEIGDRNGEGTCYEKLGVVYRSVGEYDKAREHLEKSLSIGKKSVTEMKKPAVTQALELSMDQLANMIRRRNTSRNH